MYPKDWMYARRLAVWMLSLFMVVALTACGRNHKKLPDAPTRATRSKVNKREKAKSRRRGALVRVGVVQVAKTLVGHRKVILGGETHRADCSGFVGAVYESQGVMLARSPNVTPRQSAAQSMYLGAAEHYRVFKKGNPRPGDLVFFHNTYDANRDGKWNDDVTHVGVVESVDEYGTVVIVHFASGKVKRGRMNLARPDQHRAPDGRVLNDFLRRKRKEDGKKAKYLSGQLFQAYAAVEP